MTHKLMILSVAAAVLLGSVTPIFAATGDPLPGVDILVRKEPICPCTYGSFGAPDLPTIPADFFGPGSDPFDGTVALEYLDPVIDNDSIELNLVEGTTPNVFDIEIEPLTLTSIEPIDVGGGSFFDITFHILADGLPPGEPVIGQVELPPSQTLTPGASNLIVESFINIAYEIEFNETGTGNPAAGGPLTGSLSLLLQDIDAPIWRQLEGPVVLGSDGSSLVPLTYASGGGGLVLAIQSVPEPSALLLALGALPVWLSASARIRRGRRR